MNYLKLYGKEIHFGKILLNAKNNYEEYLYNRKSIKKIV